MRATDMDSHLGRITLLLLLAASLSGCRRAEQAPVIEEEPRVPISLPAVALNKDGTPVLAEELERIEVPSAERVTLALVIDASDADSKPYPNAMFKILRTTQTGKTTTMDSFAAKANDEGNSEYTYQGDIEAPEKPGDYLIAVTLRGKEFCRHKLRVVALNEG